MSCIVKGCKSRRARKDKTDELITFHRFPKNELTLTEWKQRISRPPDWTPKTHSSICSKHFETVSFEENATLNYRRLKENAMPTLNLPDEMISLCRAQYKTNMNLNDAGPSNIAVPQAFHPKIEILDLEPDPLEDIKPNVIYFPERSHLHSKKSLLYLQENPTTSKHFNITTTVETQDVLEEYKKKILKLEKELERVKKINKRRLRKINTLLKRNTRIAEKNVKLYNILLKKA